MWVFAYNHIAYSASLRVVSAMHASETVGTVHYIVDLHALSFVMNNLLRVVCGQAI